jgi:hypothetical protein
MPAYTNISNGLVAVGAKPFATTMQALRDNPLAIAEGDPVAVGLGITIKDAALDTGAATTAGTTWVGLRTAGLGAGDVGSYALLRHGTPVLATAGSTFAGATLAYASANGGISGSPAGTWRLMGRTEAGSNAGGTSLFLRIS